jgi:hypothetical protein
LDRFEFGDEFPYLVLEPEAKNRPLMILDI